MPIRSLTPDEKRIISKALADALTKSLPPDIELLGYNVLADQGPTSISWSGVLSEAKITLELTPQEATVFLLTVGPLSIQDLQRLGCTEPEAKSAHQLWERVNTALASFGVDYNARKANRS